jgi:hypothetical protein
MFGLFVFVISLQSDVHVSNHLSREDCLVAAAAIKRSEDVQNVRCEFFKPKSVEEDL